MKVTNTNSDAVVAGDHHIAKRTASEELEDTPASKRTKNSEAPSTISSDHEPKPTFRVPFPEKVCQSHTNKYIY
jgi:hypothetical protein